MSNEKINSSILSEHRSIVNTRYILAMINFFAILAGTIVTLIFVSRRGVYDAILTHLWILLVINVLQLGICITEYVLRNNFGISFKWMPPVSYGIGALWILTLVGELVSGTLQLGTLRTDLAVIAGIQLIVAVVAYLFWPMMDRRAIDAMTGRKIRDDEVKRHKKSKSFVRLYGVICGFVILLQVGALVAYKMPPKFYDLFADTRALQYELNDDKTGYIVTTVYKGTSKTVNIPATYNNLPVVGISQGALLDDNLLEKYQVKEIIFGTATQNAEGETVYVSNLKYIGDNAIANNKIEKLMLPASITSIGTNAVTSTSLKILEYSANAEFKYESFAACTALSNIIMSGDNVGKIVSLNGMDVNKVTIQVDKEIYNEYRENNFEYVKSFTPILESDEFCVDFFTNCGYYIDSIFCKLGEKVYVSVNDLVKQGAHGVGLNVDTLAYINNPTELGTDGAKAASAFRGWYFDENCQNEIKFTADGKIEFTSNTSLYAKWIDEYVATLNWGTFKPADAPSLIYWTNADRRTFPVVSDRVGYTEGLYWTVAGTDNQVTDSEGISKNITLNATWILDEPTIFIEHLLNGAADGEETSQNYAQFEYDENKTLTLSAQHSHPLDGATYNGMKTQYVYEWVKASSDYREQTRLIKLQNVAATGEYTLKVTVMSPYGETATSEVGYETRINKKPLDMGDVAITNTTVVYDSMSKDVLFSGNVGSANVEKTFNYYKVDENGEKTLVSTGNGPAVAGKYTVEVLFAKDNAEEAANYDTKLLTASLEILPKSLTFVKWSYDEVKETGFTYNGNDYTVRMIYDGVVGLDQVELIYDGNVQKNVGDYYRATVVGVSNPNYSIKEIEEANNHTCDWVINPKTVYIDYWVIDGVNPAGENSVLYDGKAHTVSAVISGVIGNDELLPDYGTSAISATGANQYTAVLDRVSNKNYVLADTLKTFEWKIAPRQLTVNYVNSGTVYYNGGDNGITVEIRNFMNGDEESFTLDMLDFGGSTATPSVVKKENGVVTLKFTGVKAATYATKLNSLKSGSGDVAINYVLSAASKDMVITPAPITIETQSAGLTYNGKSQKYLVYVKGIAEADLDKFKFESFTTNALRGYVSEGSFVLEYNATNAGSYDISVSAIDAPEGNYALNSAYTTTFSVARRQISVSKWQIIDKAKGGDAADFGESSVFTYNYSGYEVVPVIANVADGETVTLTLSGSSQRNKGNYQTVATLDSSYTNYELVGSNTKNWAIDSYLLEISWLINGSTSTNFVYDGEEKVAVPQYTLLGPDDTISINYNRSTLSATDAGNYTIYITTLNNANYRAGGEYMKTWSITPRTVTVNWTNPETLVYNGNYQGPLFTLEGLVASDITSGKLTINAATTASSVVSGYSTTNITFAVDAGNNYSFAEKNLAVDAGQYSITAIEIRKDSVADGNYAIENETVSFKIDPKTVQLSGAWEYDNPRIGDGTYVPGSTVLVYNAAEYKFTTSIASGIVERLGTPDVLTLRYKNDRQTNAGSVLCAVSGIDGTYAGNYKIDRSNMDCKVTISPKVVQVVWIDNTFVYNGAQHTQSARLINSASADDDGYIYNGDECNISYSDNVGVEAGTYVAKAVGLSNPNYVLAGAENTTHQWSIAQRPISVSWSYSYTVYNGMAQYPKATVNNVVSGDSVQVTGYEGYTNNINAGEGYKVTVTGVNNRNYTLVGGNALTQTYTIDKCELGYNWYATYAGSSTKNSLSSLVYNGSNITVKVDFTNIAAGDVVNAVYGSNVFKNAGTNYSVTLGISGADAENYRLPDSAKTATFNIAKKQVSVVWTWDGTHSAQPTIVYDGKLHTLKPTITGLVSGDTTGHSLSWSRVYGGSYTENGAYDAGKFMATVTGLTNDNYTIVGVPSASQYLEILPQPVKISWSGTNTVTYDGKSHELCATVVGANDGKNVDFNYYNNTNSGIAAKDYIFRVSSLNNDNYTLDGSTGSVSASLRINKRVVTLSWTNNGATFTYSNGVSHTLKATVTNAVSGDTVALYYDKSNTFTNAGSHTVNVTDVSNSNYTVSGAENLSASLKIDRITATVMWSGATSFTYDGQSHSLTVSVKDADGNNVAHTVNGNSFKDAKSYRVSVSISNPTNYIIDRTTLEKIVTVSKRVVGINWAGMGEYTYKYGSSHTIVANPTNVVSGDSISIVLDTNASNVSNVGTYNATAIGIDGSSKNNYTLSTSNNTASITIVPQTVKITWTGTTVEYDGFAHEPSATVRGYDDNANVAFEFTKSQTNAVNAGAYQYGIKLISSNYTLAGADGSATAIMNITPRAIRVAWSALDQVVGNTRRPSAKVDNLVSGDSVTLTITTLENILQLPAGSYNLEVLGISGSDAANYTLEGGEGLKAVLTVK